MIGQQLEELCPDPPPLVLIGNGERHLRCPLFVVLTVVAGEPDHLAVENGDERHAVGVVDVGEELDLFGLQSLLDPEEAEIARFRPETLEELDEQGPIGGLDRPDPRPTAVTECYIELVFGGVLSHGSHATALRKAKSRRIRVRAPLEGYTSRYGVDLCGKGESQERRSSIALRGARARFLSPPPPTGPGPTTFFANHIRAYDEGDHGPPGQVRLRPSNGTSPGGLRLAPRNGVGHRRHRRIASPVLCRCHPRVSDGRLGSGPRCERAG